MTRRANRWILGLAVLGAILATLVVGYLAIRPSADLRAFGVVRAAWNAAGREPSPETRNRLAERCLEVNRQFPGTVGGLSALLLGASRAPDTSAGQAASREFARQIETADPGIIAAAFYRASARLRTVKHLARPLLARVRRTPDHPKSGQLLAECCAMTVPAEGEEPPAVFQEAADLLVERYAARPDINHFPEALANEVGSAPWATAYEKHLRAILAANQDRAVRCAAEYALASVVLATGDDRQAEAEALFEKFCKEFDGKHAYHYKHIEEHDRIIALRQLKELQFHAAGKPASEIDGVDLDNRPMKLSELRGRVVLMSFWGTWCFPCMKLVPHEREVAQAFAAVRSTSSESIVMTMPTRLEARPPGWE